MKYKSDLIDPLYKKMERELALLKSIPEFSVTEKRPMTKKESARFDAAYRRYNQVSAKIQKILTT